MYDFSAIKKYILFLQNELDLSVSIHITQSETAVMHELSVFNTHTSSYCLYLKNCRPLYSECVKKQNSVCKKASSGAFCGTCHAGVTEYVFPIQSGGETVGFVSVSGYKSNNCKKYLNSVSQKYGLPIPELEKAYSSLKPELPDKTRTNTVIMPLCDMLELALAKSAKEPAPQIPFGRKIADYLRAHSREHITSRDICNTFFCSRSYMSREFNRCMGMSVKEYLTELRIEDAKFMLTGSRLTVTEISLCTGFSDPSYFSSIFKKHTGTSPREYRKQFSI